MVLLLLSLLEQLYVFLHLFDYFGSHFALQFAVLAIWVFISYPMTFIGTVFGKNWNGQPDNPCRINPVPRRIPDRKVHYPST